MPCYNSSNAKIDVMPCGFGTIAGFDFVNEGAQNTGPSVAMGAGATRQEAVQNGKIILLTDLACPRRNGCALKSLHPLSQATGVS